MSRSIVITSTLAIVGILVVTYIGLIAPKRAEDYSFKTYCGSCHALPDPSDLPRHIWENNVLPNMGARLGIRVGDYDPLAIQSPDEIIELKIAAIYPMEAKITLDEWESITDYILSRAPLKMKYDTVDNLPTTSTFNAHKVLVDQRRNSFITNIRFLPETGKALITNAGGDLIEWDGDSAEVLHDYQMPLTGGFPAGNSMYALEIGQMHPTDLSYGKIWKKVGQDDPEIIDVGLRRPVHLNAKDLDNDGLEELMISEFGNQMGQFSIYHQQSGEYQKKVLGSAPGTLKSMVHDMDLDGRDDIIVLTAQGNEGVIIFYQRVDMNFTAKQVIRNNSVYGTSDFDLFDYEGDGDMDIAIAFGDNADLSAIPKPYHGVRLYINDGSDRFEMVRFLPMYGATQVEAGDFDSDGDIDLAATAFFAEYDLSFDGSFLLFENQGNPTYDFEPYRIENSQDGRWITLGKGDIDQDGDLDLFLGSFVYSPDNPSMQLQNRWADNRVNLLYLENLTVKD